MIVGIHFKYLYLISFVLEFNISQKIALENTKLIPRLDP